MIYNFISDNILAPCVFQKFPTSICENLCHLWSNKKINLKNSPAQNIDMPESLFQPLLIDWDPSYSTLEVPFY